MSYWSDNPELYDEIIFREMVAKGLAQEDDDPAEAVNEFMKKPDSWKLASDAEQEYWADRADAAEHRRDCREDR